MLHVGYIFHSFAHSCSGGGKLHSVGTDILLQAEGSKAAKMRRQHLSPPIDTGESVTGGNVPELSWPRTRHMARTEHDSNSQFIGY